MGFMVTVCCWRDRIEVSDDHAPPIIVPAALAGIGAIIEVIAADAARHMGKTPDAVQRPLAVLDVGDGAMWWTWNDGTMVNLNLSDDPALAGLAALLQQIAGTHPEAQGEQESR